MNRLLMSQSIGRRLRRGLRVRVNFRTGQGVDLLTVTSTSAHSGTTGPMCLDADGTFKAVPAGFPKGLRGARIMSGISGSPAAGLQVDENGKPYISLGSGNGYSWYDASGNLLTGVEWWGPQPTTNNQFWNSHAPVTQTRTIATGTYTCWMVGSGSVALSGNASGTVTDGSPVTFTLGSSLSVTFTVTGSPTFVQCLNRASTAAPTTFAVQTASAITTINAETVTVPFFGTRPLSAAVATDFAAGVPVASSRALAYGTRAVLRVGTATDQLTTFFTGEKASSSGALTTSTRMIGVVLASDEEAVFANGVNYDLGTPAAWSDIASPMILGSTSSGTLPLHRPIHEVRIWDRKLSLAERRAL